MKRTFIISAIAFIALASCHKESTQEKPVVEPLVFTASIDGSATKTTVDTTGAERGKVYWDETDTITITDAASNTAVYQVSGGAETSTATFTKKSGADLTAPPYTAIFGKMDTVQTYTTGDVKNLPMSATSQTTSLTFKVTCGLLRVNLTDASNSIKRIEVTGTPKGASASSTFSLTFTEAQSITTARDFYITLPAGTYKEFAFVNSDNRASVKSNSTGLTIDTNKVSSIKFASIPAFNWLPGKFSVSATTKVRFSKGNLQYQASTKTWQFAANQYDYIGKAAGNNTAVATRSTQAAWIDLFGWGATGENNYGQPPYSISTTNSDYKTAQTASGNEVLTIVNRADWGFCIGGQTSPWHTLSGKDSGEWYYLINTRSASTIGVTANARYAKVKVTVNSKDICGLLLFPDVFTWDVSLMGTVPINCNTPGTNWANVPTYTEDHFLALESAGVVFLPTAGGRNGLSVASDGQAGGYWSSSASSATDHAFFFLLTYNMVFVGTQPRYFGNSVRLVSVIK